MISCADTFDVESYIVRAVVVRGLCADLAMVQSVVGRSYVLYYQTPLLSPLIVVDVDSRVADERKQTDC